MKSNSDQLAADRSPATPQLIERHYTVAEVASLLQLSRDFVRRTFENEPGVLVFGADKSNRHKRRYRTLRIPQHVLERVLRRRSQV
jgi:predicted transcriptional regulator